MTYTRIFGRGYTLDDPDMMAILAMVANAIIYVVYYVQLNVSPEHYETNMLYQYGDIFGLAEACFCVLVCLRDDDWFWFLPVAGQYGIPLGRVQVETKILPQLGRPPMLLTNICRSSNSKESKKKQCTKNNKDNMITVPIFTRTLKQPIAIEV